MKNKLEKELLENCCEEIQEFKTDLENSINDFFTCSETIIDFSKKREVLEYRSFILKTVKEVIEKQIHEEIIMSILKKD